MFALRTFAARGRAAKCDFSAAVSGAYQYIDTYTGTNTATLGTHQSGDVLVAIASRDGSATAPSIPAGQGWGSALSTSGANSLSYVLVGKIAAGASEGVGTFTNATSVAIVHFRPGTGITPAFGATATSLSGATVNLSIPALTGMSFTDGSSTVLGFYMHRSTDITGISTPPSGMTLCTALQDATDTLAVYRSSSQVSSWAARSVSFTGTSSAARTVSLELCWPSPNDSTPNAFSFPTQTGVALSSTITSETQTLSGTNIDTSISVSGGEYSVNGGAFTSSSGTITPGSTFAVRHTSSASNSTNTVTTLTIGGVQGTFTSTTLAASGVVSLYEENFDSASLPSGMSSYTADGATMAINTNTSLTYNGSAGSIRGVYPSGNTTMGINRNIAAANTYEIYIQFRAKMPEFKGGCKMLKIFGGNAGGDGSNYANFTLAMNYSGGAEHGGIYQASFGDGSTIGNDSGQVINLDGSYPQWCGRAWGNGASITTGGPLLPSDWGTTWHKFRIRVKFNSGTSAANEVNDGIIWVEIDDVVRCNATGLFNRHYSNAAISHVELFGISQNAAQSYEVWFDDFKLSTGGFV